MKKIDIEVTTLAYTNPWKWEQVMGCRRKVEKLEKQIDTVNKKAAKLIKEVMNDPQYPENYKKVKRELRRREVYAKNKIHKSIRGTRNAAA